jgi:hypothetical protein
MYWYILPLRIIRFLYRDVRRNLVFTAETTFDLTTMRSTIFFIAILGLIGCSNADGRIHKTSHFKIFYTQLDEKTIKDIADSLENNYRRIITALQSSEMPPVNVHLYADINDLQKAVKASVPNLPAWALGLATSVSEIHLISPNHPKQDYQTMIRNLIHEFVHCVSLNINNTIGNNPRWLWETVAIYQANLPWDPRMLSYLVNQQPPSINDLNQLSNTHVYEVGYFIGEFIAAAKGMSAFNELIKNNGNLKETLKMDEEEFTRQWFAFMKRKHGI